MNLQMESIARGETRREQKKGVVVAACGAVLTAAALAGFGLWHTTIQGNHSRVANSQASAPLAGPGAGLIYFLAGSSEQAQSMQSILATRDWDSAAQLIVRVVDSPEEAAFVQRAIWADYDSSGAPIRVLDLRAP